MRRASVILLILALPLFAREVRDPKEVLNDPVVPSGFVAGKGYIEPPMVKMAPGSYKRGSWDEENEQPVHRVKIDYAFEIGKYEVTFDEYDLYCKSTGALCPDDMEWGRGKRAVFGIGWHDAQAYAQWLSEQSGKHYRLPTEAEWEYVTRAGSETPFFFGESVEKLDEYAWHEYNSGNVVHTVGQKKPNAWGLYDVYGNVWEWCEDTYADGYKTVPVDGSANTKGGREKVLRGGGYGSFNDHMRSAMRFKMFPFLHSKKNGFRLVREIR